MSAVQAGPTDRSMNRAELLERVIDTARVAGKAVLEIYGTDFTIRSKADASPVTEADEKSEAIIRSGLESLLPGVPIVSEEAASAGRLPKVAGQFWLVAPMDGTKEFIA